jgi:hypothetical protein
MAGTSVAAPLGAGHAGGIGRSVRRNPVMVAGVVIGEVAAVVGAVVASGLGQGAGRSRARRPLTRLLLALASAGATGALVGRFTQRWTWSDDRVGDELLDAEAVLWDELELDEA